MGDERDARDVEVAVFAAEAETLRKVGADDVAVEDFHGLSRGAQRGRQRLGDRRLAGAGEPGQPHDGAA